MFCHVEGSNAGLELGWDSGTHRRCPLARPRGQQDLDLTPRTELHARLSDWPSGVCTTVPAAQTRSACQALQSRAPQAGQPLPSLASSLLSALGSSREGHAAPGSQSGLRFPFRTNRGDKPHPALQYRNPYLPCFWQLLHFAQRLKKEVDVLTTWERGVERWGALHPPEDLRVLPREGVSPGRDDSRPPWAPPAFLCVQ